MKTNARGWGNGMAMRKMGNQLTRRGGVVVLNADALSVPPWQPLDGGPVRGTSGAGCERWPCTSEAGNRSTSQYEGRARACHGASALFNRGMIEPALWGRPPPGAKTAVQG